MSKKSIWDFIKKKEATSPDVTIEVSAGEIDTLMEEADAAHQTRVSELEAQIATLTQERDDARADLQTRDQELATAQARISTLEEEVRQLGEAPAAEGTEVTGDDQSGQEDDNSKWLTAADKAAREAHDRKVKRMGKAA